MKHFTLCGTVALPEHSSSMGMVTTQLKHSLKKHYNEEDISVFPTGLKISGNLKGTGERAVTKATIDLRIDGTELNYKVEGRSGLGWWPWTLFTLGMLTLFVGSWFWTAVFLFAFSFYLIPGLLAMGRPKQYIADGFSKLQFELGKLSPISENAGIEEIIEKYQRVADSSHVFFAPNIPGDKLANAISSYAEGVAANDILVLLDDTFFGGGNDGMIITATSCYAHSGDNQAKNIAIKDIKTVGLQKHILEFAIHINDEAFVNVTSPDGDVLLLLTEMLKDMTVAQTEKQGEQSHE